MLFMVVMTVSTVIFAPLAVLTFPWPFHQRYWFISRWTIFNLYMLAKLCRLRFEVEGAENIPARSAIIFCKHQSTWETFALQKIFPPQVWILKRELLWMPFFGWGLAMLEPIAIDRKAGRKAVMQLLEQGARRLQNGRWVVVFPEGTRVAPGARRRYGIGGALLAEKTGHLIVPVAHNAGEYWPRRGFIKHPGTIRLVIGPTIDPDGLAAEQINKLAEDWIETTMQRITTLSGNAVSAPTEP
ncbi:MAG: 1-acyl-sn-glycerol-3-phosphate acyltransferase [Gammaproteobacteria bacterium]|nr:MAG: 1-acyl-sn-glycerol-3-phosphate acyltransferase [Gammaproteobacteria bacterium]TND06410.1 MAG: 1-acyl-sn-glycerol-3-phosphate acyltransferase [Gammaproteobacteria bacterium]